MSLDASTLPRPDKRPAVGEIVASVIEDAEILHASLKAGSVAQIVVAIIAIVGLLYFLKLVLITSLVAMLIAFVLEPIVSQLSRIAIPRAAGALLAVIVAGALASSCGYFLYRQVDSFSSQLPQYSERIRQSLARIAEPFNRLERSTRSMANLPREGKQPIPVQLQDSSPVSHLVFSNFGTIGELLLAIGFVPFLTYFMLACKDHAHAATVRLFPEEHRRVAYMTVAKISRMIRSFLIGNLVVGLIGAACFTALFWYLGVPFSYFIGVLCGFLNLIPSIGALLALLPPMGLGMGILHRSSFLIILIGVSLIHLVTINFFYPKLVGRRVLLNPLAVVLSLLFWAWIWGGMGLVLAIPIMAAVKIVCDHTDSLREFGAWLGT